MTLGQSNNLGVMSQDRKIVMEVPKGTLSRLRGGLQRFQRLLERLDGVRQHPQELSAQL